MRSVILLSLVVLSAQVGLGQDRRQSEALAVKNLITETAPDRPKVRVLFRSLVASEGKLVKFDDESFYLKKGHKHYRSFYRDVLEIRIGKKLVSNVVSPSTPSHGSWSDINKLYAATKILVVLADGKTVKGFSNSATDSHIIMIKKKSHSRLDVPRDKVVACFGLLGGYRGARAGAARGSEDFLQPGSGDLVLAGIGAGIGAIVGALMKSDGRPILIYSK